MTRVAVDALGGDRAPDEIVAGARRGGRRRASTSSSSGPPGLDTGGLELVDAPDVIEMAEKPAEAVRAKPDSSLVAAVRAVADGDADAVVSAGNTGAMLAAGLLHIRRLPGVLRPAIAVPIPTRNGPSVLIDAGANADNRPEHLLQFGVMGSIFAEEILGIAQPDRAPALDRRGAGEGQPADARGARAAARRARAQLRRQRRGRDLLRGAADVVVTDGFTGNMALKLLEGTIVELFDLLREEITATTQRQARRPADPAGRRGGSAPGSTRTPTAAPTCSACAASP